MKLIHKACVIAICLGAASGANAQLGGLGGLMGGSKTSAGASGDLSADVGTFMTKSAALSALTSNAVSAINAAFESDQELEVTRANLASIASTTDPKEKLAKSAELYNSQKAKAQALLDSGEMEKRMGSLSADKKKMIGQALLNFGVGGLQAADLAKNGQALVQSAATNPMNLTKIAPVKDALPLLGKVVGDAGSFLVGVLKLAKGANIAVPEPKSTTTTADVKV